MRPVAKVLAALVLIAAGSAATPGDRLLDNLDRPTAWTASSSDGVEGKASTIQGDSGRALRLDYDFARSSGYAFVRRELPLELPDNFELRFKLRGAGPANTLEIKLVDQSGDNVWWHRKTEFRPPKDWTSVRVKRRQIEFAWGPTKDKTLRRAAAIEFVVAAGSGGGKGWIALDDLVLRPLPRDPAVPPPVRARGSADGRLAVDGNPATLWRGSAGKALELDLGYQREFGGLVLHWAPGAFASDYAIELSPDGRQWRSVREVRGANGGTDWLRLEESEARFVRLRPLRVPTPGFALAEIEVQPLAFGASDNSFVSAVAAAARRGLYPRGFVGEQNYWTLVATPEGGDSGLMDEDGAIEVGRGGFSVEPFVLAGDRLFTWADVKTDQRLRDGSLPVPGVEWSTGQWTLSMRAIAQKDRLLARYSLRNSSKSVQDLALVLAVRPFQVNPPQQFLNITGGVSRLSDLRWDGSALHVNGAPRVIPASRPDEVKIATFDSGPLPAFLSSAAGGAVADPTGLASAALIYRARLEPGEKHDMALELPLPGAPASPPFSLADAARAEEQAVRLWQERLGPATFAGPDAAEPLFSTLRTSLAHILMTREGPALRPGSRAYARSWIRDGAMMSTALLRLGEVAAAEQFLNWYAPFQYPDGKVPCCVDRRGADPVPEHDSHGELIHLVAQLHRYAPDRARSERLWPRVRAAADYIESLRNKTKVPENRSAGRRQFYGLLPPSISHEGYSAKPMHSYWDDFWALAGLKDAAWLAQALGKPDQAALMSARAQAFRSDILASIAAARDVHGIAFIPGAADLGDFDATSTTIALSVAGEQHHLPADALAATFERYWSEFVARRDGARAWEAYTPYEWRNVGAFTRLGWRDRATELVSFFMADRRPTAWNQWAEVVGRQPREPRFLGDMPHGWVASDFINAVLDMLVYEREQDRSLVLASGIPGGWLEGKGVTVSGLRTPYGTLGYSLRSAGGWTQLEYRLNGTPPPGGLVFEPSRPEREAAAGIRLQGSSGSLRVRNR